MVIAWLRHFFETTVS